MSALGKPNTAEHKEQGGGVKSSKFFVQNEDAQGGRDYRDEIDKYTSATWPDQFHATQKEKL